jgi:hypothetical protein
MDVRSILKIIIRKDVVANTFAYYTYNFLRNLSESCHGSLIISLLGITYYP